MPAPSDEQTAALASLPPARQSVLRVLRARGETSAGELAQALDITPGGARQLLTPLVRQGLVEARQLRQGPGRPKARYRLARRAEELFPKRYGDLAHELLDDLAGQKPKAVAELVERRGQRRAARARERLAGKDFAGRVAELARILDEDGYLAGFEAVDGGFRLVEHNCAILDVAQRWGQACSSELQFLQDALPDAQVRRVAHLIAGAHVCAYEVTPTAG